MTQQEPALNGYEFDNSDNCMICLCRFGKQNPFGLIEEKWILCCGHIVGSECITDLIQKQESGGPLHCPAPNCGFDMVHSYCLHIAYPRPFCRAPMPLLSRVQLDEWCIDCDEKELPNRIKMVELKEDLRTLRASLEMVRITSRNFPDAEKAIATGRLAVAQIRQEIVTQQAKAIEEKIALDQSGRKDRW